MKLPQDPRFTLNSFGNGLVTQKPSPLHPSLSKIDSLLKTLQVRPSPPEALVQAYLIHIGDRSEANFRKILELKGTRKHDVPPLVDLFNAHCNSSNNAALPASSAWLAGLSVGKESGGTGGSSSAVAGSGGGHHSSVMGGGNYAVETGRFDVTAAANLGSAIMSAAREGVDRLGTPSSMVLGGAGSDTNSAGVTASSSPHPPNGETTSSTTTAHINENLKNFGKFFRREGGAFGRFGRGSGGEGSGAGR